MALGGAATQQTDKKEINICLVKNYNRYKKVDYKLNGIRKEQLVDSIIKMKYDNEKIMRNFETQVPKIFIENIKKT